MGDAMESVCRHCGRVIHNHKRDGWVDLQATGDDIVWRIVCDASTTLIAEHEPTD